MESGQGGMEQGQGGTELGQSHSRTLVMAEMSTLIGCSPVVSETINCSPKSQNICLQRANTESAFRSNFFLPS